MVSTWCSIFEIGSNWSMATDNVHDCILDEWRLNKVIRGWSQCCDSEQRKRQRGGLAEFIDRLLRVARFRQSGFSWLQDIANSVRSRLRSPGMLSLLLFNSIVRKTRSYIVFITQQYSHVVNVLWKLILEYAWFECKKFSILTVGIQRCIQN